MKNIILILVVLFCVQTTSLADHYIVQLAAYGERVDMSHFTEVGILDVHESVDNNNIYKYYMGTFTDLKTANSVKKAVKELGFAFAREINVTEKEALCLESCNPFVNPLPEFRLNNLFFDFDEADLTVISKVQLNLLVDLLNENRNFEVELHAHTDAKGSNGYNNDLASNREQTVLDFLKNSGLNDNRINSFAYGESKPIAANSINGQDYPQGRKLNRRVELVIKEGSKVLDYVNDIYVGIGTKYRE